MSRIWPLNDLPMHEFRPATDPAKILPERRTPLLVNQGSSLTGRRNPARYESLDAGAQALFDAQYAAWRAGCALVAAADAAAYGIGISVSRDAVSAWESARDEYEFQRECARERKASVLLAQ